MGFMTERKAKSLFEEYKAAELSGDDSEAAELEARLKAGGWRITYEPDGWTIVREPNETLDKATGFLPRNAPVNPYQGGDGMGRGVWIAIGAGILLLILATIAIIQAVKKKQAENVYTRLQKGL